MIDRVSAIILDAAALEIIPRFRTLQPHEIAAKDTPGDPDDLVTVADKAAERYLIQALDEVLPGATFVGEESACDNPELLTTLSRPGVVWLIDPIDGTKNFAKGHPNFGVMLALVDEGVTRAAWMFMPAVEAHGRMVVARQNGGTSIDGAAVKTAKRSGEHPRGTIHDRLMPGETASDLHQRLHGTFEPRPSTGSAATEYTRILSGDKDFVIYYRLLPWDHAAGALAVTEAGGAAIHLTGLPYSPRSTNQVTIVAATPDLAETIRDRLIR